VLKDKKIDNTYIDKIINLEIYIPKPNQEKIKEFFEHNIVKIFEKS
jgi:hypothetical protein